MFYRKGLIVITFLFFSTCGSMSEREESILNFPNNDSSKYDSFLVSIKQYTSNGVYYHNKYYKYLIGIARSVYEGKNLSIIENSIGFYYDKKDDNKDKLYLGIDIKLSLKSNTKGSTYSTRASNQLKDNLSDIIYIINSCQKLFNEDDIVGMVVGMFWKFNTNSEMFNIWIDKRDVILFEKKKLTIEELIERNTITNKDSRIIMLPI